MKKILLKKIFLIVISLSFLSFLFLWVLNVKAAGPGSINYITGGILTYTWMSYSFTAVFESWIATVWDYARVYIGTSENSWDYQGTPTNSTTSSPFDFATAWWFPWNGQMSFAGMFSNYSWNTLYLHVFVTDSSWTNTWYLMQAITFIPNSSTGWCSGECGPMRQDIYSGISNIITLQGIANNLNEVDGGNVNNFTGLYFAKMSWSDELGRISFFTWLDLTDTWIQNFLSGELPNSIGMIQWQIWFNPWSGFIWKNATLTMNLPYIFSGFLANINSWSFIVRTSSGWSVTWNSMISSVTYGACVGTWNFACPLYVNVDHFTEFDLKPFLTYVHIWSDTWTSVWSGDTIYLAFTGSEPLTGLTVMIESSVATYVWWGGTDRTFSKLLTGGWMSWVHLSFTVLYSDYYNNSGNIVTSTTDGSYVEYQGTMSSSSGYVLIWTAINSINVTSYPISFSFGNALSSGDMVTIQIIDSTWVILSYSFTSTGWLETWYQTNVSVISLTDWLITLSWNVVNSLGNLVTWSNVTNTTSKSVTTPTISLSYFVSGSIMGGDEMSGDAMSGEDMSGWSMYISIWMGMQKTIQSGAVVLFIASINKSSANFDSGDIIISWGVLTNFATTGNAGTWYIFTVTHDGTAWTWMTVKVEAGVFTDSQGNPNDASYTWVFIIDDAPPTVMLTSDPVNGTTISGDSSVVVTITFNESSEMWSDDVTIINGIISWFSFGSWFSRIFTAIATWGNTMTIVVETGAFTDDAGNPNDTASNILSFPISGWATDWALIYSGISSTLTSWWIVNNLNWVDSGNVNNFTGLYFAKINWTGEIGRITFGTWLDLSSTEIQQFLSQNVQSSLIINQWQIWFNPGTGFIGKNATLKMNLSDNYSWFLDSMNEDDFVVRNAEWIITGNDMITDVRTQACSGGWSFACSLFLDVDHFTQFDLKPFLMIVYIESNNSNHDYEAVSWDTVQLTFFSNDGLNVVSVTIAWNTATVTTGEWGSWIASYTLTGNGPGGDLIPFTIDFNNLPWNSGNQVTWTTDWSYVQYQNMGGSTGYVITWTTIAGTNVANYPITFTFGNTLNSGDVAIIKIIDASGAILSYSFTSIGSWETQYLTNIDASSLVDWLITLSGYILNALGSLVTWSNVTNITTKDTTPATVNISGSPAWGTQISGSTIVAITATFNEIVSGFTSGDVTTINWTLSSFTGNGSWFTFNVTPITGGTMTIQIGTSTFADNLGNPNTTWSNILSYNVYNSGSSDTTSPIITLVSPTSWQIFNTWTTHHIYNVVDDAEIVNCTFYWSGDSHLFTWVTPGTWIDAWDLLGTPDGTHRWNILCIDQAGNTWISATQTFTIDTIAPIVSAGSNKIKNSYDVFVQTWTIDNSGNIVSYAWSKISWTWLIIFWSSGSLATTIRSSSDWTFVIRLTAVDTAWNIGTGEMTVIFDTILPTFAWVISWAYYSWNVTLTFSDTNLSWATLNGVDITNGYTTGVNGLYTFVVSDLAGNSTWATFTINTVAPIVSAGSNKIKNSYDVFVQTWTVDDSGDIVSYAWSKVSWTWLIIFWSSGSLATTIRSSSDWTFVIRLTAVDTAWNIGTGEMTVIFDTILPTVPTTGIIYAPNSRTSGSVEVTLTGFSEAITGLNPTNLTFTNNGTWLFTFYDLAGNTWSTIATVTWIDTTAPTASVVYSITWLTNQNVIATLSWSETLTGTTTHTFTSNGSYTFNFEDLAGNTWSATATVTWIDKSAVTWTISYSITWDTNQDVIASITFNKTWVTVTNNSWSTWYIFTGNNSFIFIFQDVYWNTWTEIATVTWIDKSAVIGSISYSPSSLTNQDVTATISFNKTWVTVTNNSWSTWYIFTGNNSFIFNYQDAIWNTWSTTATVTWIDKSVVTGSISYSPSSLTNQNVTATILFNKTWVTVTNNSWTSKIFTSNNTWFAFIFQDLAGNTWSQTVNITWIDKVVPTVIKLWDWTSDYSLSVGSTGGIIFSEAISNTGQIQSALTFWANYVPTYNRAGNTLIITANSSGTTWANDVAANIIDMAGNAANLLLIDSAINTGQLEWSGNVDVTTGQTQVVIGTNSTDITIPATVTNATILVSVSTSWSNTVALLPEITLDVTTSLSTTPVNVQIPDGANITAPSDWNGVIAVPTIKLNSSVTPTAVDGKTNTVESVIEVWFTGWRLIFDKAVRLLIPGQAGNKVWYTVAWGSFNEITNICSLDNQSAWDALDADSECKIDASNWLDLVIWTKHFTSFTTYTQTTNSSNNLWWAWWTNIKDDCPNGDDSSSFYDDTCDASEILQKNWSIIWSIYSQELNNAYLYAFDIWITTMNTIQKANMEWNLIRSHMAKMMVNYAIKVLNKTINTGLVCEFDDIFNETAEMRSYIKFACQLWLMWVDINSFYPNGEVTRAQFGTVLSRALYGDTNEWWDIYYVKHLNALKTANIMKIITDPENMKELRWYVMLMLMRAALK